MSEFLFCDSLIDVFQSSEEVWTFSVRFGSLYSFTSPAIYQTQREASQAAKYHALIDMCWRSRELYFVTAYPGDRIVTQSEELTAFLGGVSTDVLAEDLYFHRQERIDFVTGVSVDEFVASQVKQMKKMDGGSFDGVITSRLFEFGEYGTVLVEHLEPVK